MAKKIQIIPKGIVYPEAIVLDDSEKWIRELYQEADAKTAEKFGKNSLAYKTITNGIDIENVTGSQFFWNTNLGKYLPKNQRVILLQDMEKINDQDENFFKGFYTDSPQIVLRTDQSSWKPNKYILENLVKQVKKQGFEFSSENPLIISNLELAASKSSKNQYGLLLKIGKDTRVENDSRFAYSNNEKQIQFGENKKTIFTKEKGLSRVCLYRGGLLDSDYDGLASSGGGGRVVVLDAEGVAHGNLA